MIESKTAEVAAYWAQMRGDLLDGNDWYGQRSRHLLISADRPDAVEQAASLLET